MRVKKLLCASFMALAWTTSGFASTEAAGDPLTDEEAQIKALKGHTRHTGLGSMEQLLLLFSDGGKIKRAVGKPMLAGHEAIERALNEFVAKAMRDLNEETGGASSEKLLNLCAEACIQATLAGSPQGSTALIVVADYMEKAGKPAAFSDLYTRLTTAAISQLEDLPFGTAREKAGVISTLTEHAASFALFNDANRLVHMALAGNTVAADEIWRRDSAWASSQPVLIGKASENGSKTFQGVMARNIFKDSGLTAEAKKAQLAELLHKGYLPAADYLGALHFVEIDADASRVDEGSRWGSLLALSNESSYVRDTLANMLTGAVDPVTAVKRTATDTFKRVVTGALDLPIDATPYKILRRAAKTYHHAEWHTKAALRVAFGEGKWATRTLEERWEKLEALSDEHPAVMNLMVGALNSHDDNLSMGWNKKSPEERLTKLIELVNAQNAQAAELYQQIMLGGMGAKDFSLLPKYFGVETNWVEGLFNCAVGAASTSAQKLILGHVVELDIELWSHLFNVANVLNSANDGKATRYGAGPDFH